MLRWLIHVGIILGKIIGKSSNWQHIQRLKTTILGANWLLFRLERIAKCSYFILSTQNIKFHWFVMKIKFLLPIWWYNRDWFPLRNKYFGVFVLNGLIIYLQLVPGSRRSPCKVWGVWATIPPAPGKTWVTCRRPEPWHCLWSSVGIKHTKHAEFKETKIFKSSCFNSLFAKLADRHIRSHAKCANWHKSPYTRDETGNIWKKRKIT